MNIRIGQGIDFHRLEDGLELWLGGVKVPSEKGCVAHSDGDVLLHAICDALLGAAGLRDIGHYFPDNDPAYRKIDSKLLLERTVAEITKYGFSIINIDSTICLERPRVAPHIAAMKEAIGRSASISPENISVKATTSEKMGFTGRGEGVFAVASVLLEKA
ncbi:MAG: 2-C-methyl-D-erythritol 2,4-cyclodiphosphate synthase [Bacteroidales bacterium]